MSQYFQYIYQYCLTNSENVTTTTTTTSKIVFILVVPHSAPGPMGTLYSLNQILYIGGGLYCNRGGGGVRVGFKRLL